MTAVKGITKSRITYYPCYCHDCCHYWYSIYPKGKEPCPRCESMDMNKAKKRKFNWREFNIGLVVTILAGLCFWITVIILVKLNWR